MTINALLFQALNGLSSASGLFLLAAGLSLIFGVTRIVNVAHGSLYMLGLYIAYSLATHIGGAVGFWGGIVLTAIAVGLIGAGNRSRAAAPYLPRARAVPIARHLRAGADHQRRHAVAVGSAGSAGPARARPHRRGRNPRPPSAELRPVPHRRRPGGAAGPAFRAGAQPLRAAGARRHAGPRDGRRARRQPGHAVHRGVCARRGLGRARRRAAARARAGQSRHRPHRHQRRLRRRRGRRHGLDHRRLSRRRADRRGEGAVHRHRPGAHRRLCGQFLQAHFGRRIPGDGGGADRAALWPARPGAGGGALGRRPGRPDPPGRDGPEGVRRHRARALDCAAVAGERFALHAGARHRRLDRRAVRSLAAFHHGAGRHAVLRPRRLFRPRRLWRGAAGEMARPSHGPRACRRAHRRAPRRAAVRLVRGAAGRRLSRHDHPGVRADRLGAGVSVGGFHRRLQRRDRHLAAGAVRPARRLFPADAGAHGRRRAAVAPPAVRALRLRHARRPRQSLARRGDRHRRQARALARLRHCRRGVRRRRRAVRLRQGLDLAGDHPHQPLHRRPGHGAARRRADADRADRRRRRVHHAAGHGDARHPVLARHARRHHPGAGAAVSRWARRRPGAARWQAALSTRRGAMP